MQETHYRKWKIPLYFASLIPIRLVSYLVNTSFVAEPNFFSNCLKTTTKIRTFAQKFVKIFFTYYTTLLKWTKIAKIIFVSLICTKFFNQSIMFIFLSYVFLSIECFLLRFFFLLLQISFIVICQRFCLL